MPSSTAICKAMRLVVGLQVRWEPAVIPSHCTSSYTSASSCSMASMLKTHYYITSRIPLPQSVPIAGQPRSTHSRMTI